MLVIRLFLLVSLGVSLSSGYGNYDQSYKGFNSCGVEGWSCRYVDGKFEITYKCSPNEMGARIWVWTARLPGKAEIFTVRECNHLEVHMDCTKGSRPYLIKEFRVYNVSRLEFLTPILPGIFLHDNDQVPQAPPIIRLENVDFVKFFPGIFDKQVISECRYKFIQLTSLEMINVKVNKMSKNLLNISYLDNLVMKNLNVKSIESNAINVEANTTIIGTKFSDLPTHAITIRSENVSFINNTFGKIGNSGLKISSKHFLFYNNTVEEVESMGLNVLGAKVDISHNVFEYLGTQAFEVITPGYSPRSYQTAFQFSYKFTHNFIKNINPGSLHFNWEVYSKLCVDVEFKHNLFMCSCMNLGWVSVSSGLGPKITKAKEFYDTYLYKEGNTCYGYEGCSLGAIIPLIQDVCNNKTNVSEICKAQEQSTTKEITTTTLDNSTPPDNFSEENTGNIEKIERVEERRIEPALSYMENQNSYGENQSIKFIVIPLIVILALAALFVSVVLWWFKKKKQSQVIHSSCTTLYKNEKDTDADSLVVIHEHHNELYDKQ